MKSLQKYIYVIAITLVAFMWLKELTQRRAFEAARRFVYPIEDIAPYAYSEFSIVGTYRLNGKPTGPAWLVLYGNSIFRPELAVSLFGKVLGSNSGASLGPNYPPLDDVIDLSPDERRNILTSWVNGWKERWKAEQ